MKDPSDAAKEAYLQKHLEARYGVSVVGLEQLDRGVFSVKLADGRRWIARVFAERRTLEQVEGDAEILQFLEHQGFPAERCADPDPVSSLYGRSILVTEYIEGSNAASSELSLEMLHRLGERFARLHMLPAGQGSVAREAGSLHHYAPSGGGPEHDLLAAAGWLDALEEQVPSQSRSLYESLREQVAGADHCQNLPEALIHPDPVLKNLIITKDNELVFIDWTGAGRGPRIASLALLIWSSALIPHGWSSQRVDALVAGYCEYIHLEDDELARLADIMQIRPLVFACWRYRHALRAGRSPDGSEWWWPSDELSQAIAARVCATAESSR